MVKGIIRRLMDRGYGFIKTEKEEEEPSSSPILIMTV